MKIAIDGNIIEIENIYRIGNIITDSDCIDSSVRRIGIPIYNPSATISFIVYLYDDREIYCGHTINYGDIHNFDNSLRIKLIEEEVEKLSDRMISIKSELTKLWSNNQSKIQQFNSNDKYNF